MTRQDDTPQRPDRAWEDIVARQLGMPVETWIRRKRTQATEYNPDVCVCCGHPVHPEHKQQCRQKGCNRRDHHYHLAPVAWRAIARELGELTGMAFSYETLRNRWPDPPDPRRVWGADEQPI